MGQMRASASQNWNAEHLFFLICPFSTGTSTTIFLICPTLWNAHRNEHYIFKIYAHPLKHPQESALHFFLRAHPSKCPLERALHFSNCPALAVNKVSYNYTNLFLEQVFSLFLHVIFFSGEISFAIFWERNWENFGFFFPSSVNWTNFSLIFCCC
jgi:hypothetical protein